MGGHMQRIGDEASAKPPGPNGKCCYATAYETPFTNTPSRRLECREGTNASIKKRIGRKDENEMK